MKFNNNDNNKWLSNILKVVDTLNTINGGMSSPKFKTIREEDGYEMLARVPGVSPESLRIEVIENKLMIYHLMDLDSSEIIPNVLNVTKIPEDVDVSEISAVYEGKKLIIHMPFNNGIENPGLHRTIDIYYN